MPTLGDRIYRFIVDATEAGRTVYASTYLVAIKIQAKHLPAIRVRNGHCEVRRGKRWDSINGCKITAS